MEDSNGEKEAKMPLLQTILKSIAEEIEVINELSIVTEREIDKIHNFSSEILKSDSLSEKQELIPDTIMGELESILSSMQSLNLRQHRIVNHLSQVL